VILHLYHCNRAIIKDKPGSVGRNRPHNIQRYPSRPGQADFAYEPPTDGFATSKLGSLLSLLQNVDLAAEDSVLQVKWDVVAQRLGVEADTAKRLLGQARERRLIDHVTIAVDHNQWMKHSDNKGCLVVMACAEQQDTGRSDGEVAEGVASVVHDCLTRITNEAQWLDWICLVPNVHLAPREPVPEDGGARALEMLMAIRRRLEHDFSGGVHLASFGYSKIIDLAINAHPIGYQIRVV
jgi:hypothetical protein